MGGKDREPYLLFLQSFTYIKKKFWLTSKLKNGVGGHEANSVIYFLIGPSQP